ncbi:MAG TPA: extracellular solute-binding protein [Mobilitalea sp.]|nr:extracellular solute-binding protein [Mobilitalea sp.]
MKKSRKLLAMLLASTMVLSMAACQSKSAKDTGPETTTEPTVTSAAGSGTQDAATDITAQPTGTGTEDPFANYPAFDMGGRTIKIAMFYDMYYDSTDTVPEDNPNVTNVDLAQKVIDNVRRIEQKYNVRIEYINPGSEALIDSLNTSVVAGTPDYDVYLTQLSFGLPLAVNGYFENLSDISKNYEDINISNNIVTPFKIAGTNCFFSKSGKNVAANYLVYNADMLKQLGLEDPNDLYQKGEWTWDKFEELCVASNQDSDNNGVTDIYGYGGDLTLTLTEFLASNNAILVKEDGTEGVTDPKTLEVFQFLSKLYNDDKAGRPLTSDWNDNIYAWTQSKCVFSPTPMWIIQTAGDINFNYRIVPWPQGPSGDGTKAGQSFNDYFAIPKGVQDADKVYQIMEEFFGGWYGNDLATRDSDMIELAEGCFLDENDVNTAFQIGERGNGDIWSIVDTNYIISNIFNSVCTTKDMTAAQAVEANKQLFQEEIDKLLK